MTASDKVELAHEPDFVLGRLTVSPSRRQLVRDDGASEVIEHRVMQVLVALSKAEGGIVTRDELIMLCWNGRVVGDDAIHRVISQLRKIASGIGAGSLEIETITKIGYRLTSEVSPARELVGVADRSAAPEGAAFANELRGTGKRKVAAVAATAGLALAAGLLAWAYLGGNALPVVAVGPADSSRQSQSLARDLFVKLGTLPQVGSGQWQLVDTASAQSEPDLVFRTAATTPAAERHTNLTLLDGRNDSLLWSREFNFPASRESDLRQLLSLTAARVLDCALEARRNGGLPPGLLRLFLNGCAAMAETSAEDPQEIAGTMRAIVTERPRFAPAWARLLTVDANILQLAENTGTGTAGPSDTLRRDIEAARRIAPDLTEITLAQIDRLPPRSYAEALDLLQRVKSKDPEEPEVWSKEAITLAGVGRMNDSIQAARRAAQFDPLSPAMASRLISMLAWSGATDVAREELARTERLWPGTGALRDAQFAFHMRYGDARIAQRLTGSSGYMGDWDDPYLQARMDPSPAKIDRLLRALQRHKAQRIWKDWGYAVQALGEFHRTDEAFDWLRHTPPDVIAIASYVLFRPALAEVRRDPRFMEVSKRIGLVDYWQDSGHWPDFCMEPGLPYDCRKEAARLGS